MGTSTAQQIEEAIRCELERQAARHGRGRTRQFFAARQRAKLFTGTSVTAPHCIATV